VAKGGNIVNVAQILGFDAHAFASGLLTEAGLGPVAFEQKLLPIGRGYTVDFARTRVL
jgi:hypothetical protein